MSTADMVTLATIIFVGVAILISIFALMWQIHNRFGERLSEVEREQARLEGANGALADVLKQQSHTHESDDRFHYMISPAPVDISRLAASWPALAESSADVSVTARKMREPSGRQATARIVRLAPSDAA